MMMYRLYEVFGGRIQTGRDLICPSDAEAYSKATAILLCSDALRCDAVELWSGKRRVGVVTRNALSMAS